MMWAYLHFFLSPVLDFELSIFRISEGSPSPRITYFEFQRYRILGNTENINKPSLRVLSRLLGATKSIDW